MLHYIHMFKMLKFHYFDSVSNIIIEPIQSCGKILKEIVGEIICSR
jgi:hypothetical protein